MLVVSSLILAVLSLQTVPVGASVNGGATCAGCTVIVGLLQQASELHNRTITQEADALCSYLTGGFLDTLCQDLMNLVIPLIAPIIEQSKTADVACNAVGLCNNESGVCRLFPKPSQSEKIARQLIQTVRARVPIQLTPAMIKSKVCKTENPICRMLRTLDGEKVASTPESPKFDSDGDRFSTYPELRGYYWRGKDCDDYSAAIFPGRATTDVLMDENCNGVAGLDLSTGRTYEQEWCDNTQAMGVAALGDSATAHFRIPPGILTASQWSKATFAGVIRLLENEGDWPMLSWSSGFLNASEFSPDIEGPMVSIYSLNAKNNRCNKNDYQNIGVNGADSGNLHDWATYLNRNGTGAAATKPLLLFFSMIGNDVCGHEHDFSHMTTPSVYKQRVKEAILLADSFLPKGSKIVLVPLVDGRILYDTMAQRIHPIGLTHNDVTYATFYDYLNCLDISPCWGWMNTNETVRNGTWAIAQSLNNQLPIVVNETNGRLVNAKVFYPGYLFNEVFNETKIPHWELIEPVDGFHPSQAANALIAEVYWKNMQAMGLIPPPNPNNAKIISKFGP